MTKQSQPASQASSFAHGGSFTDGEKAQRCLVEAAAHFNVVTPAASIGAIPDGFEVTHSLVTVDVERDTYPLGKGEGRGDDDRGAARDGDRLGLSRVVLDRIATAAGIVWDHTASGRTDDRSNPYFVAWQVVGYVQRFDCSRLKLIGNREIDARDGSALVEGMMQRYRDGLRKYEAKEWKYPPKDPMPQIRELRMFLAAHCETKARCRAIRSLGLSVSYDRAALRKPFICFALSFTGRCDNDPELRREFSMMRARAALGAMHSLYGAAAETPRALPPAPRPPPAITAHGEVLDDDLEAELPEPATAPAAPERASEAPPRPAAAPLTSGNGLRIPRGGREAGLPLAEASSDRIEECLRWFKDGLRNQTTTNVEYARRFVTAAEAELAGRGAPAGDAR